MTLNDPALVLAATAVRNAITHLQLHSANPGPAGTTGQVGTRTANTGSVDADGDISWTNVPFTGLSANQPVSWVSYWSASTGGTFYGATMLSGDATANVAGAYTIASVTETSTAS